MTPLVILTGPTAVGKTELSLSLAKEITGEIISADSMQVYRHMNIGTAKISPEEMQGIPHHLIDILNPEEEFHVVQFQTLAQRAIKEIDARGHIPILTGGTGFYIQALLYGIDFTENETDPSYRQELSRLADEKGSLFLHQLLKEADPESAELIHANNRKRIIRALEFFHFTGTPISKHNRQERQKKSPYRFCYLVLHDDRDRLYENIDRRVDQMIKDGLEEEVAGLQKRGCTKELISMQGLGYKEMLSFLEGEISREEAIAAIKQNTRRFAKRQLTWFRREKEVIWIEKKAFSYDQEAILHEICHKLREKNIL